MCRFLAYKGEAILLADLLTRPYHSLIKQSFSSKLRAEPLNGDGFGIGWYDFALDRDPGLFTSLTPAWGNKNLLRIASKIKSPSFFAHVRAATPGLMVAEVNCHPFQYKNLLWMHNGYIADFHKIKRTLRGSIRDDIYNTINGTTDSEHAFALFLNFLPPAFESVTTQMLADAMEKTIAQLNSWSEEAGITERSNFNFAVTDGKRTVVTRYAVRSKTPPESLYTIQGSHLKWESDMPRMGKATQSKESVIIASEPLTKDISNWKEVPSNSMLTLNIRNEMEIFHL